MGAVQFLARLLQRVLAALRNPVNRSLRRLLQLWALLRQFLLSGRFGSGSPMKRVQGNGRIEPSNTATTTICTSQVPTQLSPIIGGDTPTFSQDPSSHLSPHHPYEYPPSNGSRSSQKLDSEDEGAYRRPISRNYFPEQSRSHSRASSRAPSSFRNSHTGAEDAALRSLANTRPVVGFSRSASPASRRSTHPYGFESDKDSVAGGSYTIGAVVGPSRSASPASIRSEQASHLGAEGIAMQGLRTSSYTHLPSPTAQTSGHKAHSMVDLRPPSRNFSRPSSPSRSRSRVHYGRSSSARSHSRYTSRSRTPVYIGGNATPRGRTPTRDAPPAHCSATPCSSSPRPQHPTIRPCTTIARYDRGVTINQDKIPKHMIPSLTMSYSHENLPKHWTPLAHPEGALYWVREDRPIYTDAYLCESSTLDEINRFLEELDLLIEREGRQFPEDYELVLELGKDEETGERTWDYYFIDHANLTLFWLHDFDPDQIFFGMDVESRAHMHHELQSLYYGHWEAFPHNREVHPKMLDELIGILIHAGVDSLTSPVSTSIYSEEELHKLLGFIKSLKSNNGNFGYAACVVGRLMCFFAHARFVNFYGQNCARLSRNQSVYETKPKPRSLLMVLSAFLFFAPEVHLKGLESIYTDMVICQHMWIKFIGKLQNEWQEFILYATVLLNANVAFLAIPSVDPSSNNDTHTYSRTPSQIASYLSVIAAVGSIITGLLLIRQHRTKKDGAEDVDNFLKRRSHPTRGFETLAIMYSLPYSLLMWAMISFLAAFSLECIVMSSDMYARIPPIVAWVMIGALVVWCVTTGWETDHPVALVELVVSRLPKMPWNNDTTATAGDETEDNGTNSPAWATLWRVLPRRKSTGGRSSTLVGSPTESPDPSKQIPCCV